MSEKIAEIAKNFESVHGEISYRQMVCNQFVVAVLREAVDPDFPMILADQFTSSEHFVKVEEPRRGDLVHWPGHIGIIVDANSGEFIGSQTSTGVAMASYKSGYWNGSYNGKRPDCFLRFKS